MNRAGDLFSRITVYFLNKPSYFSFTLSGSLIGSAFIFPSFWWLALLGVALFLYAVESENNTCRVILGSYLAGTIKAGIALCWYFTVYPADWLGGPSVLQQILLLGGSWFGSAISVGAGAIVIALLVFQTKTLPRLIRTLLYPLYFVIGDICGAFFFSVYTLGDGNPVNAYFGFSMLGYLLADHTLLRIIASYAGIFGLTYAFALISVLILFFVKHTKLNQLAALCGAVLMLYLSGLISISNSDNTETIVASVSTNFPSVVSVSRSTQERHRAALETAIETALAQNAQIILLPEDVRFGSGESEEETRSYLRSLPHVKNAVVVDSSRIQTSSSSAQLRAFIHDIDSDITYTTDKRYMVPVGEFLPTLHKAVVKALGGLVFFEGMQYVGHVLEVDRDAPKYVPNVLFCFESGVANLAYSKNKNRKSSILVHPVSHGWFHTPTSLWNEERQMLTVQALHAGVPILQAGNKAPSVLYRKDGTSDMGTVVFFEKNVTVTLFKI